MRSRLTLALVASALPWVGGVGCAAGLLIESLDGPVTRNEIAAFRAFMQARPASDNNVGNDWVYGESGKDTEALGMMFEISGDLGILDQMIRFADAALACRNDSTTGRILWTGKRELCWPNKAVDSRDALSAGAENGDVIGHIGYCAKLILKSAAVWTNPVAIGDPHGFGATYRARALTYIRELDRSIDAFILPNFVSATDSNHYRWPDMDKFGALGPRNQNDRGKPIPWNQQTMLNNGFLRLAECHELLGDDPVRASKYYAIVRANLDWFLGDLHSYERNGHTVYDWGYSLGRRSEDVPHGGYDIWGLCRAFANGKFDISRATMAGFAHTLRDVIYDPTNKVFAMRVDGTSPGTKQPRATLAASWTGLVEFVAEARPDFYYVVAEANGRSARTKPLEAAFILSVKHQRHLKSPAANGRAVHQPPI